jgi:gliding motility-associated-like protein
LQPIGYITAYLTAGLLYFIKVKMRTILTWVLFFAASAGFAQEICNNGIDDDADGLIDINDSDCICNQILVTSLIPNGSFETYNNCLPDVIPCPGWFEANQLSPDYYNPACNSDLSNVPQPYPDGEGVIGQIVNNGGSEYIGTCLNGTLNAGTTYQLTFNITADTGMNTCNHGLDPIDITLYGSGNCADMPLPMYAVPNASTPFVVLGSANYTPVVAWGELTIVFTPTTNINALIIGGPEFTTMTYDITLNQCRPYFVYDNMVLNKASLFGVNIQASGNYCTGNMVLTAQPEIPLSGQQTYQWYLNGVAIAGATQASYSIAAEGPTGNYQVMLSQNGTCVTSSAYTLSNVTGAPQYTTIAPTCSTNGSITITTPADLYSFNGGLNWGTSPYMNGFAPGTYSVKVQYLSGCTSGASAVNLPVPVYGPAPSCTGVNASCGPTGSITVNSTASQYSFDNGLTWGTSAVLSNISAGTYQVKVKDATGCVSYATQVFIDQNYLPDPLYTVVQPYCTANGSITITSTAAQYSFDGGTTWQTSNTLNNITAGTYTLVIKDNQQCVSQKIFVTLVTSIGYPTYTSVSPGCGGNGSITITKPGAAYSFDNGATWQTGNTMASLTAGSYTVLYKDENGCVSYPVIVTLYTTPWQLYPTFTTVPEGCGPGSITITTDAAQYSFDAGVNWQDSPTKSGLSAGTYGLAVKNDQGCVSFTKYMSLTSVPDTMPAPLFIISDTDCTTGMGSISITSPAQQYSFDNGVTWQAVNTSGALAPGTYSLMAQSSTGCQSPPVAVTVLPAAPAAAPMVQDIAFCQNAVATPLTATGAGLLWYTTSTGGTPLATAPVPDTATPGITNYYVSQTVNGCESARNAIMVTVLPNPAPPLPGSLQEYCQGDITAPLEATGSNLLWYSSPTGGNGSSMAPSPNGLGTYTAYVSQRINGCESNRVAVSAIIHPIPIAPFAPSPITYLQNDNAQPLLASGTGLTWYDENFMPISPFPIPSTATIGTTTYYVSQTENGCEGPLAEITVIVTRPDSAIYYPSFFTPNDDGINETWNIAPINGQKINTFIFDRYGKILDQITSPGEGWNGTYNGHDMPATDYWFLAVYKIDETEQQIRGHFSLLR